MTSQPNETGKEKVLLGAAPQSKYQLWTKSLTPPGAQSRVAWLPSYRASPGHCQAGFGHLKPSQHLHFPWRGWSSGCPNSVLRAHLHIVQPMPISNSSDAVLHISTVCSDCQTSPIPMPGSVLLPLPTKVHELQYIHFSLLAFPVEIGPFRPVFVGTCLCVSHPLLSGCTCRRFKSSKALRKEGLSVSPAVLPNALGSRW